MKRDNGFLLARMKIAAVLHVQTMGEEGQRYDVIVLFYCKFSRVISYFRGNEDVNIFFGTCAVRLSLLLSTFWPTRTPTESLPQLGDQKMQRYSEKIKPFVRSFCFRIIQVHSCGLLELGQSPPPPVTPVGKTQLEDDWKFKNSTLQYICGGNASVNI